MDVGGDRVWVLGEEGLWYWNNEGVKFGYGGNMVVIYGGDGWIEIVCIVGLYMFGRKGDKGMDGEEFG